MAGSLNKVQLIGRLGADPEIKQMVNGKNVARLSIATSQSWKDKNSGEKNRFNHPHSEAIQRIQESDTDIYFTSRDKAIVIQSDGEKIWRRKWE